MDKCRRKDIRHRTLGLMSFISDGRSSVMAVVDDISVSGVRISQVPVDFDATAASCSAVIHAPTGDYTIRLTPRWLKETSQGMYKTVGFAIPDPPEPWKDFVKQLEGGSDELGFLILGDDQDE